MFGNFPKNGYYVQPIQEVFRVVMMVNDELRLTLATCEQESDAILIAKLLNKHENNWAVRSGEILLPKAETPRAPKKIPPKKRG